MRDLIRISGLMTAIAACVVVVACGGDSQSPIDVSSDGGSGGATGGSSSGGGGTASGGTTTSSGGTTTSAGGTTTAACDLTTCQAQASASMGLITACCVDATTCGIDFGQGCTDPSQFTGDAGLNIEPETIVSDPACAEQTFGGGFTMAGCCDPSGVCGFSTEQFAAQGQVPVSCMTQADLEAALAGSPFAGFIGGGLGGDGGAPVPCGGGGGAGGSGGAGGGGGAGGSTTDAGSGDGG